LKGWGTKFLFWFNCGISDCKVTW